MLSVENLSGPLLLIMIGSLSGLVIAATSFDCSQRRIPNALSLGAAGWAIVLHASAGGMNGVWFALSGWAVGFACLLPGYALGKTGAGDVKLLAAAGCFIGPKVALAAGMASIVIGAVMALGVAMFARGSRPWGRYAAIFRCLLTTGHWVYIQPTQGEVMAKSFPFAPAIALGSVFSGWYYLVKTI